MQAGEQCWRDSNGAPHLALPWRVVLPDGTTRTDPDQWSHDSDVLAATGWSRSALTNEDVAALTPPPQPSPPQWLTPHGWSLGATADDVAWLTGLYVLASRRQQLDSASSVTIRDISGELHTLTFSEFDALMLAYGAAMEISNVTA